MNIAMDSLLRRLPDVRFRRVGDESVVVKQSAGEVFVLNGIGGRVLELADGTLDLDGMVERLGQEFDGERAMIASDVERFACEMREAGLIEVLPETGR
jgi:hypothetical protein